MCMVGIFLKEKKLQDEMTRAWRVEVRFEEKQTWKKSIRHELNAFLSND